MSHILSPTPFLRRDMLGGLGSIAVASMLKGEEAWQLPDGLPMMPQRAKRVIWLFMRGGVSHMESFDPKPMLTKYAGKSIGDTPFKDVQNPEKLKNVRVVVVNDANGKQRNVIYPLQTGFKRHGQCGVEISDWFPNIGSCADEIAFIRSMWTTDDNHGAQVQFHSGRHMLEPRVPTLGAWVTYGLGSMTENLPSFINMGPRYFDVRDGHYLGPAYDAVNLKVDPKNPLTFATPEFQIGKPEQTAQFALIHKLNTLNAEQYPGDKTLAARMRSYQLAFNMQTAVPETMNLDAESAETKKLYGMDDKVAEPFARQLIVARRLAERGVRFIQLQHGDGAAGAWDSHSGLKKNHSSLARQVDRPVSGLLKDLKQRGMLDDTLVVWGGEFGRTSYCQGKIQANFGRDHHPRCFSAWFAGGGIKAGSVYGETDDFGYNTVKDGLHIHDFHATLMHLLGIDHERLTYKFQGRRYRLTDVHGHLVKGILA